MFIESAHGFSFILYSHDEPLPILNSLLLILRYALGTNLVNRAFDYKLLPGLVGPDDFFASGWFEGDDHKYGDEEANGDQDLLTDKNPSFPPIETVDFISKDD